MAILNFPTSPSLNDTYSFGGKTWVWNGQGWQLQNQGAINSIIIGNVTPAAGTFTTLSATGNITGSYIIGNGSQLTGLPASYSNTNVATYLASGTNSANIITTGNVSGTYLLGNVAFATGIPATYGNSNVAAYLASGTNSANIITTGNVSGTYFLGNGSQLTGISASGGVRWTTVANTAPSTPSAGDFWFNSYTGIKYQYTNDGTSNIWVDQSFPTSFSSISVGNITNSNGNGIGNIGTSSSYFDTAFIKATSAQYADLAENYVADDLYPPGTVVVFGGEKEITVTAQSHDTRVAGVVSTEPAYLMNSGCIGIPVALTGRVPCLVQGPVKKGDVLVTSPTPGVAQHIGNDWRPGCVIGKSLEDIQTDTIATIEVVVGRF